MKLEHSHGNYWYDSESRSYGQLVIGSFVTTMHLLMLHILCSFLAKYPITQVTQSPYSPDWEPHDFWLFPKLKSPLKGKRFHTTDKTQENTTGKQMATGRTVWGPKAPTLKGTEASLSYIQCVLYLVSCIFFSKCLYFSYCMAGYLMDSLYIYSPFTFDPKCLLGSCLYVFGYVRSGGDPINHFPILVKYSSL